MSPKSLKVVHFMPSLPRLTENWIINQVSGLDELSRKFYTIYPAGAGSAPLGDVRCFLEGMSSFDLFLNRVSRFFTGCYPRILSWFLRDRPDLIHAHFGPSGYDMMPYARRLEIPLVTSFYGQDAHQFPRKFRGWGDNYRKLFRYGRLFLAEGPAMRERLIELGCPSDKIMIHHIGVRPGGIEFRPRKPDGEIRLMVCGRFVEKKGMPFAVEAVKRLRSKAGVGVRLTIIGDSDKEGTLTDEKRRILEAIEEHGVADAVTLTGFLPHDELMKMVYDHHVFLAPSVHASDGDAEGGFPVILTEVLATGMPVVASDHCDIPYIVQDGKSGFIVPERDVGALTEKLAYLIRHPEIWGEMGRAGRRFVEEHYDIKKLNEKLMATELGIVEGGPVDGKSLS